VLAVLTALFALAWRFEPTMVVVLFGVLRSVLAMVGVVAKVVIKVKIDKYNFTLSLKTKPLFLKQKKPPKPIKITKCQTHL
jgi:hypothetical protein